MYFLKYTNTQIYIFHRYKLYKLYKFIIKIYALKVYMETYQLNIIKRLI